MNSVHLFDSIKDTVLNIDADLKLTNNMGIYFAPELYIAFCIGKDIIKNQKPIFNATNAEWLRETNLGNGGLTDIIFRVNDMYSIIELKIRDTVHSYKADIEKLKRLKLNAQKFFCVLVDSFEMTNDNRLIELEKENSDTILKVGHFAFPTWNNYYKKQIFCLINLYSIV